MLHAVQYQAIEWSFTSSDRRQPGDGEMNVLIRNQAGQGFGVPAWQGDHGQWRVRFCPPAPGRYEYRTIFSDPSDAGLHDRRGEIEVEAADTASDNPLLAHGPITVADGGRHFQHADGEPFFWLGDTWWMGLCRRYSWPSDFQYLAADRAAKGFNVVQIVAGLYPDMGGFEPRGANEGGYPWTEDYAGINRDWWDLADLRIAWLVRCGLVPCIVGCWGYYLLKLGGERMRRHWREIVARWSAWPVVWCLAGEAVMPWYLSQDRAADSQRQKTGWTDVARHVRQIDPHHRPITIHPDSLGRDQVEDDSVLDFDMLQTGHGGYRCIANSIRCVRAEVGRQPPMPVLVGEVNYEGILHGTGADVQRLAFWSSVLSGAAGHTYGANGIWQANAPGALHGPSPHGATWGNTLWTDAARLPGGQHVGASARFLRGLPWWRMTPHPDWVSPAADPDAPGMLHCAGIPNELRVVYFHEPMFPWDGVNRRVIGLESGIEYRASFVDPRDGAEHPIGPVRGDAENAWKVPLPPEMTDWIVVLRA